MAQDRVITPLDIYDTLAANTTFLNNIGDYTFTDGTTNTAFSIITPSRQLPNITSVSGLEVLIHDTGIPVRQDYLTDQSDILMTYQLFLIVWEPATGQQLNTASTEVMRTFSGAELIRTVPQATNESLLVQNLIQIPKNAAIMV